MEVWSSDQNVGRNGKRYILNGRLCHAKELGLILGNYLIRSDLLRFVVLKDN